MLASFFLLHFLDPLLSFFYSPWFSSDTFVKLDDLMPALEQLYLDLMFPCKSIVHCLQNR